MNAIRIVGPLFAVGLFAGLAIAAPTKPSTTPQASPSGLCPVPTEAQCLGKKNTATTLSQPYIETACGRKHKEVCRPFIEAELKRDYEEHEGKVPTRTMLSAEGDDIPANLRQGLKRRIYGDPKPDKGLSLQGKNLLARTKLTTSPGKKPPTSKEAAKAHRQPKWDENGEKVKSCAEFAYEEAYDWARFTDAAAACRGNTNCIIEVALLPTTPGIGERTMKSKNGKAIARVRKHDVFGGYTVVGKIGSMPGTPVKNDMFVTGGAFVFSHGPGVKPGNLATHDPADTKLAAVLEHGKQYFDYGATCDPASPKTRSAPETATGKQPCTLWAFKNEWRWHKAMYDKNGKLSAAEHAEYDRRKAKFRALLDEWGAATAAARKKMKELADHEGKQQWVSPIDMRSHDPFERIETMVDIFDATNRAAAKRVKAVGADKAIPATVHGMDMPQQQGALDSVGAAIGVLAAPVPGGARTTPKAGKKKPGTPIVSECAQFKTGNALDDSFGELFHYGPASCRIGEFLREEWARKARGQKSCLDLDNDDCDWTPEMFTAHFATGLPYIAMQQSAESACLAYSGDQIDATDLGDAEKYLHTLREKIGDSLKKLADFDRGRGAKGRIFGETWKDAESSGDKDWFAAGYDYDIGWEVQPVMLDAARADGICELGGKAHGNVGVDAWLVGGHIEVIEAEVRGDTNLLSNDTTNIHSHLRLLGIDVPQAGIDESFTQKVYAPEPWSDSVRLPEGYKPSFTVMAGFVPITGAVWGELGYGARFEFEGVPHAKNCNAKNVKFTTSATFEPYIGVDAKAQVGVGISGLVSAGIRGMVNLVTVSVPLRTKLDASIDKVDGIELATLGFAATLDLSLSTLSGYISLYVEFLLFEEEWELFRWSGVSDEIQLMEPLQTELLLTGMK